MDVFNFAVQTRPQGTVNFRRRVVQFGDGYSQKVGDGLNTRVENWTVTFEGSYTEARAVMDFLDAHAGVISFMWTPPGYNNPRYYTCPGYTEVPHVGSQKIVTMQFEEDFRP